MIYKLINKMYTKKLCPFNQYMLGYDKYINYCLYIESCVIELIFTTMQNPNKWDPNQISLIQK